MLDVKVPAQNMKLVSSKQSSSKVLALHERGANANELETRAIVDSKSPHSQISKGKTLEMNLESSISSANVLNGVENNLVDDVAGTRSKRLSPTSVMPTPTLSPEIPLASPAKSDRVANGDGNDSDVEEPLALHRSAKEPRWSATSSRASASSALDHAAIALQPLPRAQVGQVPVAAVAKRAASKYLAAHPIGVVKLQGLVRRRRALRVVKDVRSTARAAATAQAKANAATLAAGAHRFVRAVMVAPHGALGERVPSASSVASSQAAADVAAAEAGATELWPVLVETGALLPGGQKGAGALPAHATVQPAAVSGSIPSGSHGGTASLGDENSPDKLPPLRGGEAPCLCYVADPGDGHKPLWGPGDDSDDASAAHSASGGVVRLGNATTPGPALPDFRGAGAPANATVAANSLAACYAHLLANFLNQCSAALASDENNNSIYEREGTTSPYQRNSSPPVPVLRVAPLLLPDPTGPFSGLNCYAPSRAGSLARGSTVGRGSCKNPNLSTSNGSESIREDSDVRDQQPRAGRFRASLAAITWDALEGAYKALTPAQRALLAPTRLSPPPPSLPHSSSSLSSSSFFSRSAGPSPDSPPLLPGTTAAATAVGAGVAIAPMWGPPRARVQLCVANDDDRAAFATVGFTVQPAPLLPFGPLPAPPLMPSPVAVPAPTVEPVSEVPRGRTTDTTGQHSLGRSGVGNGGRSPHGSKSRGMRSPQRSRHGQSRGRERAQSSSSRARSFSSASSPSRQSAATMEADQKAATAAAAARSRELEGLALTPSEQAEWQALKAKRVSKSLVLSKADKVRLLELRGKLKAKAKELQDSSVHSSADGWSNVGSAKFNISSQLGPSDRDTGSSSSGNTNNISSNNSGNTTANSAAESRSSSVPLANQNPSNTKPAPLLHFESINEDGPMSPGIAALRSGARDDDDDEDNALRGSGRRGVSFHDDMSATNNEVEDFETLPAVSAHARACGLAFVRSRCRVRPYGLLGEGGSSGKSPAALGHSAPAAADEMTAPGSAGPDPTQESEVCLLEPVGMHKPVGALGAWLFGSAAAAVAQPARPEVVRAVQGAGHAKHAVYSKRLGSAGHSWRAHAFEVHVIHAAAPDLKRTRGLSLSRSGSLARSQPGSLARAHSRQRSLARSSNVGSSSSNNSSGGGGGVGMGVIAGSEQAPLPPREGYNEVLAALAGTYRAVLVEFSGSGQKILRLLPLSSGAQAGPWVQSLPRVTFDALELAFALLPASDQAAVSEGEVHFCLADSAMLDVFAAAGVSAGATTEYVEPPIPTVRRPLSPPTPPTPPAVTIKLTPPCSPPPLPKSELSQPPSPSSKPLVEEVEGAFADGGTSSEDDDEEEDSGFRMRTPLGQESDENEDRQANPGRPLRFVRPENDNELENQNGGGSSRLREKSIHGSSDGSNGGDSLAPGASSSSFSETSFPRSTPLNQRRGLPLKVHTAYGEGLRAMPTDDIAQVASTQQSPMSTAGATSPVVDTGVIGVHQSSSGSKGTQNSPGDQTRVSTTPKAMPLAATLGTSI